MRKLRQEVGFGCPIPRAGRACGNPYLAYHHFDPPWTVEQHHNPAGMVALCAEHHAKADARAFPIEYLRKLKAERVVPQRAWNYRESWGGMRRVPANPIAQSRRYERSGWNGASGNWNLHTAMFLKVSDLAAKITPNSVTCSACRSGPQRNRYIFPRTKY
jgi:hypothetical protein